MSRLPCMRHSSACGADMQLQGGGRLEEEDRRGWRRVYRELCVQAGPRGDLSFCCCMGGARTLSRGLLLLSCTVTARAVDADRARRGCGMGVVRSFRVSGKAGKELYPA